MRAHARVWVRCRGRVRVGLRFRLRIMAWVMVRVRVRFQEAQRAETKALQWSPWSARWRAHGRVPFRLTL